MDGEGLAPGVSLPPTVLKVAVGEAQVVALGVAIEDAVPPREGVGPMREVDAAAVGVLPASCGDAEGEGEEKWEGVPPPAPPTPTGLSVNSAVALPLAELPLKGPTGVAVPRAPVPLREALMLGEGVALAESALERDERALEEADERVLWEGVGASVGGGVAEPPRVVTVGAKEPVAVEEGEIDPVGLAVGDGRAVRVLTPPRDFEGSGDALEEAQGEVEGVPTAGLADLTDVPEVTPLAVGLRCAEEVTLNTVLESLGEVEREDWGVKEAERDALPLWLVLRRGEALFRAEFEPRNKEAEL